MVIAVEQLMKIPGFEKKEKTELCRKLDAAEQLIRVYTNNNFQNRSVRFEGRSEGDLVFGHSQFLRVGDTVQISQSCVNDGLYHIEGITPEAVELNRELFAVERNLVTKVEYPADVVSGVIDLMRWEAENRQKVGIKQETLSRHSVTYYDQDVNNSVMGYPVSLLGFLKPYMKARF